MLKGSLYTLGNVEIPGEGHFIVDITLNATHEIFSGHFPQQPVLPGVCLLEMLKDVISQEMGQAYFMAEAAHIKYMKIVDPTANGVLKFDILTKPTEAGLSVTASTAMSDGDINFKFKGLFVPKSSNGL